ncbi:MAG: M15 family metallopeptidase [Firmicutes bacterium]|nr:M15 family metallopeptidase [Bacillota bacterium]
MLSRYTKAKFTVVTAVLLSLFIILTMSGCGNGKDQPKDSSGDKKNEISEEEQAKREQLEADAERGILILVNKEHSVDKDYVPENLAPIKYYAKDRSAQTRFMVSEAADHFHELVEAAKADGIDIVMTTAYRSYDFQTMLWNNNVASKGSEEEANKTSARPGESEHQTGLAVDLSTKEINYALSNAFGSTEAGKWVEENAHKYGFILRYTEEKVDVTGYLYEPWHIRYVGTTAAKDIYESGLALEEYLKQQGLDTYVK